MRVAGILSLIFAVVYSLLAVGQVATIQTSLEGLTSGALQSLIGILALVMVGVAVIVVVTFVAALGNNSRR